MFSLTCNLVKNDVEFLPVEISPKKVRGFFDHQKYIEKVSENNVDLSTIEITPEKYVETTWIIVPSKLH